ncbi:MAG: biosynthetic-type acetolactate synthase large subunit [Mucinivorans sp.]
MKEKISGAEILLRSLVQHGVDTIFGYPGGAIMPIYDAMLDHQDSIRHILTRHEQGAAHAAQGYARVSGRVGVAFATSGPGATNLITGIADAMIDSTPVVFVVAQVASGLLGSDAFQEADMINMTAPVTKWNFQITDPSEITTAVSKAFYIASTGRPGPVVLEISKDAQVGQAEWSPVLTYPEIRSYKPHPILDLDQITKAADLINGAKNPLILCGQGVQISDGSAALVALAEKASIPVASTLMGLSGMPTTHPLYVGMIGMHGNVAPNMMTQDADVIIAVGMRFSDRVTGRLDSYAPKAKIIHIDIDPVENGKILVPNIFILADAREALEALVEKVETHHTKLDIDRYTEREWKAVGHKDLQPEGEKLTMAEVVAEVSRQTQGEAIVVTDVGQQQMMGARYSQMVHPRSFITSGGLGTMGFGLPASIGAKIAAPNRQVVLFVGDGGIQMTIQELGTIMEFHIPVKIVVLNNSFLGMVRQWQELFHKKRYSSTPMCNPDFIRIAEGYKIQAKKLSARENVSSAISEMLASDTAYLLEVVVGQEDNVFPMVPGGASLSELILSEN